MVDFLFAKETKAEEPIYKENYINLKRIKLESRSKSREKMGLTPEPEEISTKNSITCCRSQSRLNEYRKTEVLQLLDSKSKKHIEKRLVRKQSIKCETPEPRKTFTDVINKRRQENIDNLMSAFHIKTKEKPNLKFIECYKELLQNIEILKPDNLHESSSKGSCSRIKTRKEITHKINNINHWEGKLSSDKIHLFRRRKKIKDIKPVEIKKKNSQILDTFEPTQLTRCQSAYMKSVRSSGFKC